MRPVRAGVIQPAASIRDGGTIRQSMQVVRQISSEEAKGSGGAGIHSHPA